MKNIDPEWEKILDELKVIQNRITALQGTVVRKIQEQQDKRFNEGKK